MDKEEAYAVWLDWYEYNGKYEGLGRSEDDQIEMFEDWWEE